MRRLGALIAAAALLALPAGASGADLSFSNTTVIVGPGGGFDLGKANPSPSTINVAGATGVITDVNVFLNGVNAGNPDDIEAMVVGPFGQTTVLMDDAGGTTGVSGLNLAFNDESAGPIPDNGPVASQGYEPTDYVTPGLEAFFDTAAPPPPHGLTLSLFDGTSPNGTWRLFVDDDVNNGNTIGVVSGWTLSLTTTDVPAVTPITPVTNPVPAKKKCKKKRRAAGAAKKCKKRK